jgi:hypothetical protein
MPRKPMQELSDIQIEVLAAINTLYVRHGRRALSITEISDYLDKSWNATSYAIDQLIRKGKAAKLPNVPRSVRPIA